jgi:hypothetical protein
MANAVLRRLGGKPKSVRKPRTPLAVAVASAVVQRLGRGQLTAASPSGARLASRRGTGAKKRTRLSHPAARGPARRPGGGAVASAVGRALSARSRKPRRASLAQAVASAVTRRLRR